MFTFEVVLSQRPLIWICLCIGTARLGIYIYFVLRVPTEDEEGEKVGFSSGTSLCNQHYKVLDRCAPQNKEVARGNCQTKVVIIPVCRCFGHVFKRIFAVFLVR